MVQEKEVGSKGIDFLKQGGGDTEKAKACHVGSG